MTKIFLIRHGTTDYVGKRLSGRMPGIPLNEEGKQQVRKLADFLAHVHFNAIISSPVERALETARYFTGSETEPIVYDEFTEIDYGNWTNIAISEIRDDPVFRSYVEHRSSTRIPGGELISEAQARMIKGLDKVMNRYNDSNVAVISHADLIRAALAYYLGIHNDLSGKIDISPASFSILETHNNIVRIAGINLGMIVDYQ